MFLANVFRVLDYQSCHFVTNSAGKCSPCRQLQTDKFLTSLNFHTISLSSSLLSHSHLSSVMVTSSSGGLNCSSRSLFNADSSNFSGSSGSGALDGSTFSVFFSSSSSSSFRLTPPLSLVISSSSSFLVSSVLLSSPSCLALVSVSERQWLTHKLSLKKPTRVKKHNYIYEWNAFSH